MYLNQFKICILFPPSSFDYSVHVSVSCPKALYHSESDNLFHITVVVADWIG